MLMFSNHPTYGYWKIISHNFSWSAITHLCNISFGGSLQQLKWGHEWIVATFQIHFDVIIYPWPKCKVCLSKLCWKNMSQMCIESVSPVWAIESLVLQKPFTECITWHFNLSSPGLAWIHAYIMNKTWKYEHGLIFCSLRHILNDNMRISFRKCVV